MKKNRIRLTESQLHKVIKESVKKIMKESISGGRDFYNNVTALANECKQYCPIEQITTILRNIANEIEQESY